MELIDQLAMTGLLERALAEDIGQGDITTLLTVPREGRGRARIVVKAEPVVFCGGPLVEALFVRTGSKPTVLSLADEGAQLATGAVAAELEGGLRGLLAGERTVLNFLQHMTAIATLTARYVSTVAGTGARIIDTRKTHPGLRTIEKYAVRVGGGVNHRFGLDSGVLIKDNHIVAAGSITAAVTAARGGAPHTLRIEVECETLAQVEEAIAAGADIVMLDNMTLSQIRQACTLVGKRVPIEVSGNVRLSSVRAIAETGVDLISVGELTHSVRAADLSMRIENMPS